MRLALCLLLAVVCAAEARGADFDFADLQGLLRGGGIGSAEELLAALPAAQRAHFALMFESRSLQGASAENPRVILFGPDARFILTFNGAAAQRGFRAIETMEFDERSQEFKLRELTFPEHAAGEARVSVSEVNPERCARCHGSPARPIWDSVPLWPGAYGERYRASLSSGERAGLAAFLARQPQHPRYRYLLDVARFADPQNFRPSAQAQYSGALHEPPNAELALALSRLQAQAIAARLERRPQFERYQYALLGLADGACGGVADFYPEPLWRMQHGAYARFQRDTALANTHQARLKAQRSASSGRTAAAPDDALVALRFVAATALGAATDEWSLALERATYDFTLPPLSAQPLRETLLEAIGARDPAVRQLSLNSTSSDGDRYCSYLQRHSRSALAGSAGDPASGASTAATPAPAGAAQAAAAVLAAGAVAGLPAPPAALQLCVSCHERGAAPALPFSDPIKLTPLLRAPATAHGLLLDEIRFRLSAAAGAQRMPLGLNLTDSDRESLSAYFTALAASPN